MPGAAKKNTHKEFGKSLHIENSTERSQAKRLKSKSKYHEKVIGSTMSNEKVINFVSKTKRNLISNTTLHKRKSFKKKSSFRCLGDKAPSVISDENEKSQKLKKRGKRKRQKYTVELDEPARLQRRTRYLLIKMKLEQNLIDAYSTEGWKGQSREKIKPEKELQRAKKQILKCKLGIRDAIRHLDSLSSIGCIDDSAVAPDGSVYHEHIICAKCKLREAFPDNDIILCDGTCNCAFHQKCLDPPLLTENIPQGEQGWFCKFCECKIAILEAMNAHIGTHFSADSSWQDIFKEEAALPDGGDALLNPELEWPSDDSEDDDYDPNNFGSSCNYSKDGSEDKGNESTSSSINLWSLKGEMFPECGADSDATSDCEILNGRRERRAVDYRKLYDEMFGKDAHANEQISEDEDWGPTKRKRREKESDAASTLMTLCESDKKLTNKNTQKLKNNLLSRNFKRSFFRIPPNAVEKLRCVFAENELPSRSVRENLSKQLGIESEKVNKWFKNARYLALKSRKVERRKTFLGVSRISRSDIGKDKKADQMPSKDSTSKSLIKFHGRNKLQLLTSRSKKRNHKKALLRSPINKVATEFGDDVSLKLLREKAKREKKKVNFNVQEAEAEMEMERLCKIKGQVKKLQQILLGLPNSKPGKSDLPSLNELYVFYVPVAELREKK